MRTIPTKYRYEENLKSVVLWHWLAQFSDNPWTTEAIKQINNERNAPDRVASSVVLSSVTERDHLKVTISYCKVSRCLAIMVITRDSLGAYLHFSHTLWPQSVDFCLPQHDWLTMWLTLDDITHNRNQTLTWALCATYVCTTIFYALGFWILVFGLLFFCLGFRRVQPAFLSHHLKLFGTWPNTCQSSVSQAGPSVSPSVSCSVKVALPYFNGSHTLSNRIWRVYLWQRVALIIITTLRPQTPG